MYNFDKVIDRRGTSSLKWNFQDDFGQHDGLIPYWIADTDFATLPDIMREIKNRCEHPMMGYGAPLPPVYDAIQGWWEKRHQWKPEKEWMLLSFGVVTGINFALETLVEKGEKVLVFTPVYDPFFAAVEYSGHTLVDCPLDYHDNYYTINWELFEQELKNGVKAVVFCNPHNPVGRVWTYQEMEMLTDLCAKYQVYLLCDEIHADFGLDRPYTSAGRFEKIYDHLLVYTAISKSFNMAGLGSSCIMIPDKDVMNRLIETYEKRWMFGPNEFSYVAMEAAYKHGAQWMDEQCAYLKKNVEYVTRFIKENMPEVQMPKHEGTFLMWLDMSCFRKSSDELTSIFASQYGIALGNGAHYGRQGNGFMRLNIGCSRETLKPGLERMADMYKQYYK
ncbi:MalY/PatB family protein [Dorea formicigenerans]|uniref:cysteine-S-conjugate beta-lyase n=1 Tax=Dorea formicigenerans TaxID=39486 RepID=A0A3E5GSP9_9FIRM|nr:PatB family C-S lyase [Dorea formicigenerans]RGO51093.1 putative C-S lyase [Dorea formicigenerans]RGT10657.1 putative C-S lyase [Dorea formicigenerans]RHE28925.1 putative C-S lyase [Dorea formicigenerans]